MVQKIQMMFFVALEKEYAGKQSNQSFIQVDQERAIEELGEIEFDNSLPDTEYCSRSLHSQ